MPCSITLNYLLLKLQHKLKGEKHSLVITLWQFLQKKSTEVWFTNSYQREFALSPFERILLQKKIQMYVFSSKVQCIRMDYQTCSKILRFKHINEVRNPNRFLLKFVQSKSREECKKWYMTCKLKKDNKFISFWHDQAALIIKLLLEALYIQIRLSAVLLLTSNYVVCAFLINKI